MRVAICLSGQLRTWKKCNKSVKKLIEHLNHDVDIFCHTWNFDTPSISHAPHTGKETIRVHSPHTIEEALSAYNPVKYFVEDQEKNIKTINDVIERSLNFKNKRPPITQSSAQFYSLGESTRLKSEYELENNFKYDVCIRLRYDQHIPENQMSYISDIIGQVKDNTVYTVHNRSGNGYPEMVYGDIFWISNSDTHNKIALFYNNIHLIDSKLFFGSPPENVLTHYINSLGIQNHRTYLDLKVCQFEECIGNHEILYEDIE
jgi:hypothetical protein